jgi:hypothetical protein
MLNLPHWQTIGIITVTVLTVIFALPNPLPAGVLDHLPRWYAQSRILGLLTHLFTATIFTRMLLSTWVRWRRPTELPI